jgi:hypothetical protein
MTEAPKIVVDGHICKGYVIQSMEVTEYDCGYAPDFSCDECVFVAAQGGDKRKGKRPWSKKWGQEE